MQLAPLSKEQYNLITKSNADINIAHGPVRSGKNFAENLRFLAYCKTEPVGYTHTPVIFAGVSKGSVVRNFLKDLVALAGSNAKLDERNGRGKIYNRDFYIYPAVDGDDFKVLRGSLVGGFYFTEVTLCQENFFDELLARMVSVPNSRGFCDVNPDSPYHWFATRFLFNNTLKQKGIVKEFPFTFDSNLSLGKEKKDALKLLYKEGSLLYRRMIKGEWCMADGLIYDMFRDDMVFNERDLSCKFNYFDVAIDYGVSNPTVFLLIGKVLNGAWYILDEYYYDSSDSGTQKTNAEFSKAFEKFCTNRKIRNVYIDPTALSFKTELHSLRKYKVKDANNDVNFGINVCSSLFHRGLLKISRKCKKTLLELSSYVWDKKSQVKGIDAPLKRNDHCMDAMRYGIASIMEKGSVDFSLLKVNSGKDLKHEMGYR